MPVNLQILLITNVNFALKESGLLISLISTILNPDVKNKDFVLKNPPFVSLCYTKKHTHNQIQNKVKPNCLVHKGTPHPKKSWAVERRPKRNPIKENPASNSTTKKHCIDFLCKQPSRE